MEWREVAGFLLFCVQRGLSDWHCLHFTALWLCLCAGAAEVMLWFAVLTPISLDRPQDVVTILWPHNPPPPTLTHHHKNTAPSDPMTAGLAAAAHCSSDCIHALYLHTLASITLIHMWLRNAVWMINMIYIWMSVCLDFKSRSPNKCTSHHLHVCGVMVKLNNSHKLCCAHLWHCKPDTFPLIYLKCKDLWCDPFAFCNIVFFFSLCLIYCFISPCIFPAVTLQMFFCLICLCAIILFSSCAASFVFAPLNLFNIPIYNMIIVSVVLYIS